MGKLKDKQVENAKPGTYGDGDGLYLRVKPTGRKSWILRVQHMGKREDIGLGAYPLVTLAKARDKALELRRVAKDGGSARAVRDHKRVAVPSFKEAAQKTHAELSKGWSVKTGAAFLSSLEQHVFSQIGNKRVDHITTADVVAALSKTWSEKPEMARKLRVRIIQVLSFAKAKGWRDTPAPDARELRDGLAKPAKGGNFAAVPYKDAPAFVAGELAKEHSAGRLALLFTVLTAARSGEVRSARWEHIDIEAREWNRPANLMKSGVRHTVTLNDAALSILEKAKEAFGDSGLIFPGRRAGSELSDMTLSKALRASGRTETVHGFRSTFRDWAAERMPTIPAMVPEMCLAHSVGNATQQAYLRSDLRDMRRNLMDAWGRYAATSLQDAGHNIIELARAR